jgi:hypothetical protein
VTVTGTGLYGGLTSWFSILCRLACSCAPRSLASPSPESAAVRIGDEYRDGGGALSAQCSVLSAHCSLLTAHCSLLTAHCSLFSARRTWGGDDGKEGKRKQKETRGGESQ